VQTPSPVSGRRGGLAGSQITDRLVQRCWADRGFPPSRAKKGRRPDGGRYKSSLADGSLPGYPSMRSGNPFVKRTRSASAPRLFIPVLRKVFGRIHFRSGAGGGETRAGGAGALYGGLSASAFNSCKEKEADGDCC
jgi:hypothetical protein